MGTSTPQRVASGRAPVQGTDEDSASPLSTRRRLAITFPRYERDHPAALDLTARCLEAMAEEMSGLSEVLATGPAAKLRASMRGERVTGLHTLIGLTLRGRPEGKRAVRRIVELLAPTLDGAFVPAEHALPDTIRRLKAVSEELAKALRPSSRAWEEVA